MVSKKADSTERSGQIVIKKYANRRLYNTATSKYITLDHLCQMVKDDEDFIVYDAKSGDDITRSVLTQIILEEEAKGENLLPLSFLKQIISFYGQSMDWIVPKYLEHMMQSFAQSQDKMNEAMQKSFSGFFPFANMQEVGKNNMALWEQAVKMFNPLHNQEDDESEDSTPSQEKGESHTSQPPSKPSHDDMQTLQEQIAALQKQIDALSKK